MSKKIFMISNAHLDPVWQWEWEEGAAEALSTFRIAADFCEEYDDYIFCHNEAILYKWIEEYDPNLFERIKLLVNKGKWHIMGGWHLQPDCNMPSGEGFVRQILEGRKYFLEKFNKVPKIAVNVDPFGHSRGLVQIMAKSGYEGYLFMRPSLEFLNLPSNEFKWKGYDGSVLTGIRLKEGYNSAKGDAATKINKFLNNCNEDDFDLCLWGIGNHGGGPSKKDLDDLKNLKQKANIDGNDILHSTPEEYFSLAEKHHHLPEVDYSLNPWAVGCYTSQVRVKQKYRLTENIYFLTEIMCSHAANEGLMEYPMKDLSDAMYDILTVQFHDILPGSSIQPAEEMGIRLLDHALEILSRLKARAFFALASGQSKASEDKIPIFVYNPYPYEINTDVVSEFMLWDQNWSETEFNYPKVYDENGNICPCQCEKEHSNIPLDWRKRVVFNTTLKPMTLNRFECAFDLINNIHKPDALTDGDYYTLSSQNLCVKINQKTGLVDSFVKDGTEYVSNNSFSLDVYNDDYDPWGMNVTSFKEKIGKFELLNELESQRFLNLDSPIKSVHIIESGDVRTVVEAVFGYENSYAVMKYTLSQNDDFKIDVRINWNEKEKLVKLAIPAAIKNTVCVGEQPYGREQLKTSREENVSQKYLILSNDKNALFVANNGVYGSSFDEINNTLCITLLRSPAYCAHPLPGRTVMPQDRYMPYIEQGERDFSFLVAVGEKNNIFENASRTAQEFNMQPMTLSFYPTGTGNKPSSPLSLLNTNVINITTFKKAEKSDGYIVRLFNPTEDNQNCKLSFYNSVIELNFNAFEIKTIIFEDGKLKETDLMESILKSEV